MDATSLKQLENAARAAGHNPIRLTDDGTALLLEGIQQPWNPRDENPHSDCMGDALRLAVKLATDSAMSLTWQGGQVRYGSVQAGPIWNGEDGKPDPYAATRRAIVRAAAAIGKDMP